ncbi:unnamed protein product [Mesocestoides corti]|uniref:Uncharacterized protein n=1 Tax=Mesocestoides corti TaxID=53468 RepID=A0A0R3UD43_MESCO|nr:unnamed protein product [Mesocestoides corti]
MTSQTSTRNHTGNTHRHSSEDPQTLEAAYLRSRKVVPRKSGIALRLYTTSNLNDESHSKRSCRLIRRLTSAGRGLST